jgi:hypothetical protein
MTDEEQPAEASVEETEDRVDEPTKAMDMSEMFGDDEEE